MDYGWVEREREKLLEKTRVPQNVGTLIKTHTHTVLLVNNNLTYVHV